MKYLVFGFVVVLSVFCAIIDARYLWQDHGVDGKLFWGQNHTVMDGDNLTLQCGSEVKKDHKTYSGNYWFWMISDRHIATKKLPEQTLLRRDVHSTNIWRGRPYGFKTAPEHIPGTIDVKLINVNRYNTGKYVCAVATIISTKPKKNYVEGTFQNVLVKCKPRIESMKKTEIQLAAGDKLTMDCVSSGYPVPVITWRRVDGRPLPERTIKHSNGLLSIHDVGQPDRGQYECLSSNIYGNETRIFSVNITVRPRIMTTEKSYAAINRDGAVKCVAVGIPRPKFRWKWYKDGEYEQTLSSEEGLVGRFKVKTEHFFENSTSYLMIKNVRSDDFREYECGLKDGDKEKIQLVGYSKPDRPIIQTVTSTSTSITLSWKVAENDGGRPVRSIIIEYLPYNGTEWQSEEIPVYKRRHTIYKLKSNTRYALRVVAVNEIGPSDPSENHIAKTDFDTKGVPKPVNKDSIKQKESLNMMVMIAGVAGGFLVLIIAIVIMCILMRNMQRNNAKKAAENAERMAKSARDETNINNPEDNCLLDCPELE